MTDVLNQITPFNKHRFNECMAFFTKRAGGSLTQIDLVKLHVLTDVFHVLGHGIPVIGGALSAWEHGPVVPSAYNLIDSWAHRARDESSTYKTEYFHVTPGPGTLNEYTAAKDPDLDNFGESEMESMVKAWFTYSKLTSKSKRDDYFHKDSFIGKAWQSAKDEQRQEVSWDDIIDEYAAEQGLKPERVAQIKRSIRF